MQRSGTKPMARAKPAGEAANGGVAPAQAPE
jgi:hypothetical protein